MIKINWKLQPWVADVLKTIALVLVGAAAKHFTEKLGGGQ